MKSSSALILLLFAIALLTISMGKVTIVQADAGANPCPAGQIPLVDSAGNIVKNPDGSPQCRATDALS